MGARTPISIHSETEIAARLGRELPQWRHQGGAICRSFRTAGWKASLMVANAIGHLAEVAWHHPDLIVSYGKVEVRLSTHEPNGITDKDFELARKIDDVVGWRPETEDGALEGIPPGDAAAATLKHDVRS